MSNNNVEWLLSEKFELNLVMESDWHIGTGLGRPGHIDALVAKDNDQLPYIPAKTLTGIWRSACEQLAYALDDGNAQGNWSQWVELIFGSQPALSKDANVDAPQPSLLSLQPARLPKNLINALNNAPKLKAGTTFIKPGIAIDANSGRTKDDFLRFEEIARQGMQLIALCSLNFNNFNQQQRMAISAILQAGLKLIVQLGGKQRRGSGKCRLEVVNKNFSPAITEWLEKNISPPSIPLISNSTKESEVFTIKPNKEFYRLPIRITLVTPLNIPAKRVGNIVETLDLIPGTYLLPYVSRVLGKMNVDCSQLLSSGDLQVLPAYIEIDDQRGRPVPFALYKPKQQSDDQKRYINRFTEPVSEDDGQLKGLRQGYIGGYVDSNFPTYITNLPIGLYTHNTIKDEIQCPSSDLGGVYSYEAIKPNVILRSEIRFPGSLVEKLAQKDREWWKNFNGNYRLGTSKKDDYGLVRISVVSKPQPIQNSINIDSDQLVVWFLSDTLLRDEQLRPTTSIEVLRETLKEHLAVDLTERSTNELFSAVVQTRRIESWQTRWGLPRPSLLAIAAGSSVVFEVTGNIDEQKLDQLVTRGIGERRGEGYGQISFNEPILVEKISNWKVPSEADNQNKNSDQPAPLIKSSEPEHNLARQIEKAFWQNELLSKALALAANRENREKILGLKDQKNQKPTKSQWGALRTILSELRTTADKTIIDQWFNNLKKLPDKWPEDVIKRIYNPKNNQSPGLMDNDQVWVFLEDGDANHLPAITENGKTELRQELWAIAVKALVDACIKAHFRELEK